MTAEAALRADPRLARSGLRGAGTIPAGFLENVRRFPDKPFVQLEIPGSAGRITYAEAWREVEARAAEMAFLPPQSVVLIFLPQGWSAIAWYIAAMLRGLVPSFMPLPSAKQDPVLYWSGHRRLFEERIAPAALVTDAEHAGQMARNGLVGAGTRLLVAGPGAANPPAAELPVVDGAITALLQHSSGTTGLKKGVALSHAAVLAQVESYAAAIGASDADVVVSWLPLYHDMGLMACLLMPMLLGQTIVLLDPFRWVARPATLFQAIARHGGTLCWMPNFAFGHLERLVSPNAAAMSLAGMRAFINCSEPCHAETFERFQARFAPLGVRPEMLQVCYAMAETAFAVSQTTPGRRPTVLPVNAAALRDGIVRPAAEPGGGMALLSAGPPIGGAAIAVKDLAGDRLPEDRVGEIWTRADFMFAGYHNLPELTRERLVEGEYRTADRGFLHDGEIYVLGRLDDLIILNGRNFHAAEIEGLLGDVDRIRPGRSVAFGCYDPALGSNALVVISELSDGEGEADDVRKAVRQRIFEGLGIYPSEVVLVEPGWLIKTTSGKIARGGNADKYVASFRSPKASAQGE